MIRNIVCPYCRKLLNQIPNHPQSRSVEHLIPNAILKTQRGPKQGDFYACKKCNSKKSNMDYVLGVLAKFQADDEKFAFDSTWKALDKPNSNKRFIEMIISARRHIDGNYLVTLPISGREIAEYATFLAKGQYFIKYLCPLPKQKIVLFDVYGKIFWVGFEKAYVNQNDGDPIADLASNPYTTCFSGLECLMYGKSTKGLFIFHGRFAISTQIVSRCAKNKRKLAECMSNIHR